MPKGGQVISTSVIPCLSTGLAENDKIMPMFVLFSGFFGHFESLAFSENGGQILHKAVKHDILVNF